MTDLQISLMAIGTTVVVAVLTYNKWQEYKARKSVERAFSSSPDDVLMREPLAADERLEPVLEFPASDADAAVSAPASADSPREPGFEQSAANAPESDDTQLLEAPPKVKAVHKSSAVDELIDCEIPLELEAPVRGERVLAELQSLRQIGGKPVHIAGLAEDGSWQPVSTGRVYSALRAGVQLANRAGSLTELEFSEVVARLRQGADEIGAELVVPDMAEVVQRARSLHQFVLDHDAQLGVNVKARGAPWSVVTLLAALARQGFDQRPDGKLVMQDGEATALFSLSTNVSAAEATTTQLTLLLDVPMVARERDGFGAMLACARMLAQRLDGVVVDDAGQALADATLAEIAEQVQDFYSDMDAQQVSAGSARALRLFS